VLYCTWLELYTPLAFEHEFVLEFIKIKLLSTGLDWSKQFKKIIYYFIIRQLTHRIHLQKLGSESSLARSKSYNSSSDSELAKNSSSSHAISSLDSLDIAGYNRYISHKLEYYVPSILV